MPVRLGQACESGPRARLPVLQNSAMRMAEEAAEIRTLRKSNSDHASVTRLALSRLKVTTQYPIMQPWTALYENDHILRLARRTWGEAIQHRGDYGWCDLGFCPNSLGNKVPPYSRHGQDFVHAKSLITVSES